MFYRKFIPLTLALKTSKCVAFLNFNVHCSTIQGGYWYIVIKEMCGEKNQITFHYYGHSDDKAQRNTGEIHCKYSTAPS